MKPAPRHRRPLFEVRHSRIHGRGVFAVRRIRKGTTIVEYLGDRVSHERADERYADKHPRDGHTFLFTVNSRTVIDAGVGGNEARFVNHGCDPNCQTVNTQGRIFIESLRTIQPGEELAYDYQIQRDDEDPPDVDVIFACRCGAENCRGSMLEVPKKKRTKAAGEKQVGNKKAAGSNSRPANKKRARRRRATEKKRAQDSRWPPSNPKRKQRRKRSR